MNNDNDSEFEFETKTSFKRKAIKKPSPANEGKKVTNIT